MGLRVVCFELGGIPYGIRIERVGELAPAPRRLRRVPGAPAGIVGLAELRGSILTVLDPAAALGIPRPEGEAHLAVLRPPLARVALLLRGAVDILECDGGLVVEGGERGALLEGEWLGESGCRKLLDPGAVVAACERRIVEAEGAGP